jgi:iron complex outermembrane receptor protein
MKGSLLRHVNLSIYLCFLFFTAAPTDAGAGPRTHAEEPVTLDPITVTAPRVPAPITRVPYAVSAVEKEEIQRGRTAVSMDEPLMRVPGVFIQNRYNFAQDLRVSIRGFGARAAFGIRGIKVLVDGMPLTLPDGQTQIDAIDPLAVQRMEVMRGPVSALYGNAAGGVINIVTEDGPAEPYLAAGTVCGDSGLWKTHLGTGGERGRLNYLLTASRLEYGGFREHAGTERNLFTGKVHCDITAASGLTAIFNYVDIPEAESAGGLTEEMIAEDRRQASPLNLSFDTREMIEQARFGMVYDLEFSDERTLRVTGFYTRRQLDNAIPFTYIELDRDFAGSGASYNHAGKVFERKNRLTIGVDAERQVDDRWNFENTGGNPGDLVLLSQEETVTALGPYVQEEFAATENLSLFLGGRYDWIRFEVDDRLDLDGDQTGERTFEELTGMIGFLYTFHPALHMYANISESFETPTTTELVNRRGGLGGLNSELEPQKAVNYEFGMKGIANSRVLYQAVLFDVELEDELIAFRGEDDRAFFRNAGESRRRGVEIGVEAGWKWGIETRFSYTFMEAEFERYRKDGEDFSGNAVPGLPQNTLFGELAYAPENGMFAAADAVYTGKMFADDENLVETDAYTVVNLRLGWEKEIAGWTVQPFFGLNNLLDEKYNSNVRINARNGRFFQPAPDRGLYCGFRVAYAL